MPNTQAVNPIESAKSAGLRYVCDDSRGIRREMGPLGLKYIGPNGKVKRNAAELNPFRSLAVPPAWTNVWICADPRGHLQATGRDARGRKQYRYHPDWRACRDENKYDRMQAFAAALPDIRKRTEADLARPGLPREKVLATVVQLLEKSLIRVGNDEYARANRSFGLTTLRNKHVDVKGSTLKFEFRGKSGVRHSQDVNAYLKEITGEDFTAKDFRTWAGTVLAAVALREFERSESVTQAKKNVVQAIEAVAGML